MFIILFSVLLLPFSSKECSKTDIFSIFEMKSCVGELNLLILKVPINIFVDICFFLTSSLKKYGLYKRLITNYLYFCVP